VELRGVRWKSDWVLKWILRVAGIPLFSATAGIIEVEFDNSA
jgi:hypothetical protein